MAVLTILLAMLGADMAAAATAHPPHARRTALKARHASRRTHHRARRLVAHATTADAAQPPLRARYSADEASGPAEQPGIFKSDKEAGWGVRHGGAKAVLGVYQRPERPDIPNPQISNPEGRDAAGLSLSLKLGH